MSREGGNQGPLAFLQWNGVEVANVARTFEYIRNGLAISGHWQYGHSTPCGVLYRTGTNCTPTTFVSPAADPAPWYDPDEPGSADFLGLVLLDITGYDSTVTRPIVQRYTGLGGGTFGSQQRKPREWKFTGVMISGSDEGTEFGLRWLTQILQASECDTCSTSNLAVRLVCPPDNCTDDDQGLWYSYSAALTDGPTEGDYFTGQFGGYLGGCRDAVMVDFTVTAGNPFLYKPAEVCYTGTITQEECDNICDFLFGSGGMTGCCNVTAPTLGVTGSIATFEGGSTDAGSVYVAYYPEGSGAAAAQIVVDTIPAGSVVTVDSAQHQVTIEQDGVISDGLYLVSLADGATIEWVEVRDCDEAGTFCVGPYSCYAGTVNVTLATQNRQG
jgi:hypothetical protein